MTGSVFFVTDLSLQNFCPSWLSPGRSVFPEACPFLLIPCGCAGCVVVSGPLCFCGVSCDVCSFVILFIWVISLFLWVSFISFMYFFKKTNLVLLIFFIVFLVCTSFISALTFTISFLCPLWASVCSFSSPLRCQVRSFEIIPFSSCGPFSLWTSFLELHPVGLCVVFLCVFV